MSWQVSAVVVAVLYGAGMYLVAKTTKVHGGLVGCFWQMTGYAVLLALMGFGRTELSRMTRTSALLGASAAALLCVGTAIMFHAYAVFPKKQADISVITEAWPLIFALLFHFTVQPLNLQQWAGVLLVSGGMVLILR